MISRQFLTFVLYVAASSASMADDVDFHEGIFVVNEDWYGHQNSTVNYLLPDDPGGNYWHYRVFQEANPGHELGCTNQYGAIWNGRFYFIAKQDKDPGASVAGGRITVADAETMKILYQNTIIDPSGAQCDGRGFVGIDEHKGYISTSNGVWIFDLDNFEVKGRIEGTSNPNAGDDTPNTNPAGSLYYGQSGTMLLADGKVFVCHQQSGILVIDAASDKLVSHISMDIVSDGAGIGSIVKAADGSLWASVAQDTHGTGSSLPLLLRIDPHTLATETVPVTEGMFGPANSWYAWTPDAFVASSQSNVLYWKGGMNRWFAGSQIYKFDCDTRETSLFVDLETEGANWKVYGCSLGVHPDTDEVYMSLYHEFSTPTYITRRYSPEGEAICDYPMIDNYWFPSMFVFPQAKNTSAMADISVSETSIKLSGKLLSLKNASGSTLEIYSATGACVLRYAINTDFFEQSLALPAGIYIIKAGNSIRKFRI